MSIVKEVKLLYEELLEEWQKTPPRLDRCGIFLTKLKVAMINMTFLPTSNATASLQELLLARDVLEIGVQWSIAVKNIPSFQRYMAQLKCYYLDYKDHIPESAYKYQLLGLNLLFLLSQNRVADFHTELELLPVEKIQTNKYIRHPVSLEQYVMEGSYNKIFLAKGNVPAENYNFFIDILFNTIRIEIAACLEKAYEKISLSEAARMLYLTDRDTIMEFANKKEWLLGPDKFFHFDNEEKLKKKTDEKLPATELAEHSLAYARDLEMIV